MRQDHDPGVVAAQLTQVFGAKALVNLAAPLPRDDLDPGPRGRVAGQEPVRKHDRARHPERRYDLDDVGRGAADIRFGLDVGGRVHVGDDRHAGVPPPQCSDVVGGDRRGQRASRVHRREEDRAVRVQDLDGFRHEADAADHQHAGARQSAALGERERVPGDVRHAVEDFGTLVVVGQDRGAALPLQGEYRLDVVPQGGPFDRGYESAQRFIAGRGFHARVHHVDSPPPGASDHRRGPDATRPRDRRSPERGHPPFSHEIRFGRGTAAMGKLRCSRPVQGLVPLPMRSHR